MQLLKMQSILFVILNSRNIGRLRIVPQCQTTVKCGHYQVILGSSSSSKFRAKMHFNENLQGIYIIHGIYIDGQNFLLQ